MKILFFSDLHGSSLFLERLLIKIDLLLPDMIVFSGDLLYHGPRNDLPEGYNPKRCVEIINNLDSFIAVRGNCDAEVDQMVINQPIMSDYNVIYNNKKCFFITHGHVFNEENHPYLPAGSIFVSGHTHIPLCKEKGDIIYFNPGSLSIPKNGYKSSYGLYDGKRLSVVSLYEDTVLLTKNL